MYILWSSTMHTWITEYSLHTTIMSIFLSLLIRQRYPDRRLQLSWLNATKVLISSDQTSARYLKLRWLFMCINISHYSISVPHSPVFLPAPCYAPAAGGSSDTERGRGWRSCSWMAVCAAKPSRMNKHHRTNFQHVTEENLFISSNEGFKYT